MARSDVISIKLPQCNKSISLRLQQSDYMEVQQLAESNNCSTGEVVRALALHSLRQITENEE